MVSDTTDGKSGNMNFLAVDSFVAPKQERVMVNGIGELPYECCLNDSSSTSNLSNIKLTNGFKQLKLTESIRNELETKIKNRRDQKFKQGRWINYNTIHKEEKNEYKCILHDKIICKNIYHLKKLSSLQNRVTIENSYEIEKNDLKIDNYNTISESKEINGNENSSSNDLHNDNNEIVAIVNNLVNIVCIFSTNDQKDNSCGETTECNEKSKNSENNKSNIYSRSIPRLKIENENAIIRNNTNYSKFNQSDKAVCDISKLKKSSSSENLTIIENSNDNSQLSGQTHNTVNDSFQTKNKLHTIKSKVKNVESNININSLMPMMNKSTGTQNVEENSINIKMDISDSDKIDSEIKAKTFSLGNNDINNSESNSDTSKPQYKKTMKNVLKCVKEISKTSIPELEKILDNDDLTFEEFEKICTQNVFKLMRERIDKIKQRKNFKEFKESERLLSAQYESQVTKLSQIKSLIRKHKSDLIENELAVPHKITRSVGLQVVPNTKDTTLPDPKILHNLSVIEIDDDANSDSSGLPLCTNITLEKDNILPDPKISQNSSVIEIVDDASIDLKTINSDLSSSPLCTNITQEKDNILPDPKISQNSSVIEIVDDASIDLKTINSDHSSSPLCTNITREKGRKEKLSEICLQERVDLTSDDDDIIDLEKKEIDKQSCIKSTEKKEDSIKLSKEEVGQSVDITSDDDDDDVIITDTKASCSKISNEKTPNSKRLSHSRPKLLKFSQKLVPLAIPIEQDTRKMIKVDLTKIDKTYKIDLKNSNSFQAISQTTANKSLTHLSKQQLFQSNKTLVSKNLTNIMPNLPTSSKSCIVRTISNSECTKPPNLYDKNQKLQFKNIPVRPYFYKSGTLIPLKISSTVSSGLLKTSTATTFTTLQQLGTQNVKLIAPKTTLMLKHPAPVPSIPNQKSLPAWKLLPPAPVVKVIGSNESGNPTGAIISWNMTVAKTVADIKFYQIFAYHEDSSETPSTDLWRKVGEVNALPLPMACSISEFECGEKYHFAIRAIDVHSRAGPFSIPQSL